MAAPRATVTIGGLALVADIAQYRPFSEHALGVTVFDGIEATTVQDFGFRAYRQRGALSSGTGTSPGLVSKATLALLAALLDVRGAVQPISDSLGNAGTIKPLTFSSAHEYGVPGDQESLWSYATTWQWLTLTMRLGVPYTGP